MNVQAKALALIEIAERYRESHCAALLASAAETSRRMLAEARRSARTRLHEALDGDRVRIAEDVADAQARLVTARRVREQKRMSAALGRAWPKLEEALLERWRSPSGRTAWVEHHLAVARAVLPQAAWTVVHPPQWPAAERDQAARWLREHGIAEASFAPDAKLSAGIRVACGMNLLDASLEGLLADRAQIEGRLLHHFCETP